MKKWNIFLAGRQKGEKKMPKMGGGDLYGEKLHGLGGKLSVRGERPPKKADTRGTRLRPQIKKTFGGERGKLLEKKKSKSSQKKGFIHPQRREGGRKKRG